MKGFIQNEELIMNLNNEIVTNVSPYDASYPLILLSNGLKNKMAQATAIANEVYRAVIKEAPLALQAHDSMKKGVRYVVDIAENTLEAIESGKIKFTSEKGGKLFAQLRESNGQYGSKLPIKKESFRKGVDPVQMLNSLQLKALQDQLQAVAEQISMIDSSVKSVLQGQQNDRISAYYSGLSLYLESLKVENKELKNALMVQALRSLSESTFQLTLTMQSDIKYLIDKEYNSAKGKKVELIDERMKNIHQSFEFIHQSTMLRAGIYCASNEMAAMTSVLNEYSYFIKNTVASNANLLAQCDTSDSGTAKGIWRSRSNLILDVSEIADQLNAPNKVVYLGVSEGDQ